MSEKLWRPNEAIELAQSRGGCDRAVLCVMGNSRGGQAAFFREALGGEIADGKALVLTRPPHFDPSTFSRFFRPEVSTLFLVEAPPFSNHQVTPFSFFRTISDLIDKTPDPDRLRENVVPVLMTTPLSYKFTIPDPPEKEGVWVAFGRNRTAEQDLRNELSQSQIARWPTSYEKLPEDLPKLLASFRSRTAKECLQIPDLPIKPT